MSRFAQAHPEDWQDRLEAAVDEADTRRKQPAAARLCAWWLENGPTEEQVNDWNIANDHQEREVEA